MAGDKKLKAGPIDSVNGFPLWFEDESGLRLELGLSRDPLNPDPLLPVIGEVQNPGAPLAFPNNFPDESFYFSAEAELSVGGGNGAIGRARIILALEAAFGGDGDPAPGLNVVFARIRVRMDDLAPEAKYTVTHPYGVTSPLSADERGRVFYTEDLGIAAGDPTAVELVSKIAPFLQGTSTAPSGYIGDGVTAQQVTGSPSNNNFVTIEGKNIRIGTGPAKSGDPDPTNLNKVWTNEFTIQGKKATRVGAWVDGATYTKNGTQFLLNIQARSDANQDLRLVAPGLHIKLVGQDEFYTGLAEINRLPTDARLVNMSDSPPTSFPVGTFTDRITVASAVHNRGDSTLTIQATSSDADAVLTLPQLGDAPATTPLTARTAVPAEIIVKSTKGGEGRLAVQVTGTADAPQPVEAIITPVLTAFDGTVVTLDGSGSLGATSFVWGQTGGPNVTLSATNQAKVTFTFPEPASAPATETIENLTFRLTVQGSDGSSDTADIPVPIILRPNIADDTFSEVVSVYRTSKGEIRITGVVKQIPNQVTVRFPDGTVGQAAADETRNWSVKEDLKKLDLNNLPVNQRIVQISSSRTRGEKSFSIRFRN
jgi:hypothetical protein